MHTINIANHLKIQLNNKIVNLTKTLIMPQYWWYYSVWQYLVLTMCKAMSPTRFLLPGLSNWQDHSLQPACHKTDVYVPHVHGRTYLVLAMSTGTHATMTVCVPTVTPATYCTWYLVLAMYEQMVMCMTWS